MAFLFENLKVYQKAVVFAEEIGNLTESFTKGNYYLVDQLNRAALSIAINIAEGNGRYHRADRKNFFRISRGSAFECVPILELCKRKGCRFTRSRIPAKLVYKRKVLARSAALKREAAIKKLPRAEKLGLISEAIKV